MSLAVAILGIPGAAGAQSFAVGRAFPAVEHPNAVAVADLDGDGFLDAVAPSYSPDSVAVYLGDGAGGFAPAVHYAAGTGPRFAAIADFNGDGHPDAAVANQDSGNVSLYLGTGTGTLVPNGKLTSGALVYHVLASDLDGDGDADLVVANSGAASVSIFLGNGNGTFASGGTLTAGTTPRATAVADFDGDGDRDLAVSNYGSNDVWVYPGSGAGGFGTPVAYPVGVQPFTLAASDLNGDGRPDLAVPNFGSESVSVLLNNGAGGFATSTIAAGKSPRAVVAADFDNDGDRDLAVANRDSSTVTVLLGNGAGAFASAGHFGVGSGPFSLAAADFDGDGAVDVLTADRDNYSITVTRGLANGRLTAATAYRTGGSPRGIAVADLDADGRLDLVTANNTDNTVSVLKGLPGGTVGAATGYAVATAPYAVVVGDFNNDGRPDVASASSSANKVSVLRANGSGGFLAAVSTSAGSGPRALVSGDFNQDGKLDVATANYNAHTASVLLGNGAGGFAAPIALAAGTNPSGIAAADLNGDGRLDLAVANTNSNNVTVFLATGPGTFGAGAAFAAGAKPAAVTAGDVNGDGFADLLAANETSNDVTVLLGTGSGGFVAGATVAVGVRPLGLLVAELTGDESPDLAVACATTNTISVAAGHGDGTFGPPVTVAAGVFARALAVGDFDGDTQADLAVANGNGNDAWVVLNRSGALADLAVAVDDGASTVDAGAPVSYAVTVSNLGPATASAVALDLDLPAGLQGASYAPSAGAFDANTGAWTGLDLGAGDEATLTVSGTVSAAAAGTFTVAAHVAPAAGVTDPAGANNHASDTDAVIRGEADLAVSITNGVTAVAAGDAVTYTIVAGNAGPAAVAGAGVTAALPGVLQGVTWTCTPAGGASCTPSGSGTLAETVALPTGGSVTYTLHATVDPLAATGTLAVTAAVAAPSDIRDPHAANDAATDADPLAGDQPPVANPQTVTVVEDGSVGVTLTASDPDGDPLTLSIQTAPAHGVLTGTVPNLTYTPNANYSGADAFTFRAFDGILGSVATVSITVSPVNDPPQASSQSVATSEDVPLAITLGASDPDGDALVYTIVTPPALGALTGSGGARTYTPQANASGSDSFTFVVSDGQVQSAPATVSITVGAVNDAPTVAAPVADLTVEGEGTSASVSLAGVFTDVESPGGLTLSVLSSNPALVAPSLAGNTLDLALTAGAGGTAVVTVRATDPGSAFVEDAFVVTVIRPGVRLSVGDASRGEGSSAGVVFTISLSQPSAQNVTVGYATANATATAPADYAALAGTVTFAPGVTSRTVKITTVGDTLDEDDETFSLVLSGAAGATIEDGQGTGTIVDDDAASLTVLDISVAEGTGGTTAASFTVALSVPSTREITVAFTTAPVSGGATAGSDYVARSGVVTFPAGSTASQLVTVDVVGDATDEPSEAFSLQLSSAVNATIGRALARATITDDDDPPSVGVSDVALTEGNAGNKAFVFTLTLSAPSALSTRVRYQTADGSAIAASDYTARSGEIVFAAGVTSMTVSIAVLGDTTPEADETFLVNLHTPVNLTIGDAQGVGTILNDE
ncbi:MAG: FG-GAP-like repeat-containing protein [Vicinamibacteria bacterium]